MIYDVELGRADFTKVAEDVSNGLQAEDLRLSPREQYTVYAVAHGSFKTPSTFNFFFDKKLAELLSEATRLGLAVHRTWAVEELKAVIMEHRESLKEKAKATDLGIDFPTGTTKGNLMRLIRDSINTPDQELMKIGKFRGFQFVEIPESYCEWAVRELTVSRNPDPEL
ncbi:GIP, partial [Symbiodinium pilosum]